MMKKLLSLLMIGSCAIFMAQNADAQNCTPDPQYAGNPGIYPDSAAGYLPEACIGQAYSQVITVVLPTDTTVNQPPLGDITLTMNYIRVDSVKIVIAPGDTSGVLDDIHFTYSCEPPSCQFPGGQSGCLLLSGNPVAGDEGHYPLVVYVTANVTHVILGTFDQPSAITTYTIEIGPFVTTPVFTQATTDSTTVFTTENSASFTDFTWDFGDGTTSTVASPTHTYPGNGDYVAKLIACDISCGQLTCDSSVQIVTVFVGIEELKSLALLSLFPNPSNGQFNLSLDVTTSNELEIRAFNPVGQLVYNELAGKVNGRITKTLNLEHLSAGVYSLEIRLGNETVNRKIIIAGK